MNDVFTPRDWEHQEVRLEFPMSEVKVLSGRLGTRGRGLKAKVEIRGKRYDVFGAACGLPNCMCDALLKEAARAESRKPMTCCASSTRTGSTTRLASAPASFAATRNTGRPTCPPSGGAGQSGDLPGDLRTS